jgi:hypothetical protein
MNARALKILVASQNARRHLIISLAILLSSASPAARADTPIAIVVTNGATAPDGNGTINIHYDYVPGIYPVVINDAGQVAFDAGLDNTIVGSDLSISAIFRGDSFPGDLITIVQEGQAAPDGNGSFSGLSSIPSGDAYPPTLNNAGQVAFWAPLVGTIGGTNTEGLFRGSGGVVTQIVRNGWAVPDNNGTYNDSYWPLSPSLNGSGQVAFFSTVNGCMNCGPGIFRGNGGDRTSLTQIVRTGYITPFATFYSLSTPSLNDLGQVAFSAFTFNNYLSNFVFRADGTTLTRIAYGNEPAPDGNGSLNGGSFTDPALNNGGLVAFGDTVDYTVGGSNAYGLFRGDGNTLTQIVRWDQPVPDGNGRFETGNGRGTALESMNNAGQIVFSTYIAGTTGGTNVSGIYRGDGVTLTKIAREGEPAPDSNGMTFGDLAPSGETPRNNIAINDSGQVAFLASLSGGGQGIYFYDDHLGLIKVIRTDDCLLGKTVNLLRFDVYVQLGTEGRGLNNHGQVAFGFDDSGSGAPSGFAIWTVPKFQITNIRIVTNDVVLMWDTIPDATNVVQAASAGPGGSFNPSNFADISSNIVVSGLGQVSTNYTDSGGATNFPARYYRVRLVP